MPTFSRKSQERKKTCAWEINKILDEVIKHYDFTVLEGHRGERQQHDNFINGTSQVDWPDGKHNSFPSQAVDIAPWPIPDNWGDLKRGVSLKDRDLSWKERVKFYELAALVIFTGKVLGIEIRWGGDWDSDGEYDDQTFDDLVHFELV